MEFKYIPDTFNDEEIIKRFGSKENFVELQVKYKQQFESILLPFLKPVELSSLIQSQNVKIPVIEDTQANFYRRFSMLQNPYLYIRNNYHVEKLTDEEIKTLESQTISQEYFARTFERVLYEEGDITFYGTPRDETACPTRSITFEFAYDQVKCESIEHLINIEKVIEEIKTAINANMQATNMPVSFMVYNGIPKQFSIDETSKII